MSKGILEDMVRLGKESGPETIWTGKTHIQVYEFPKNGFLTWGVFGEQVLEEDEVM